MNLYRFSRFFGVDKPDLKPVCPEGYVSLDLQKVEGLSPKSLTGLGFADAAKILCGDIACHARIKAHIENKLPYHELDAELQKLHDKEIAFIVESCKEEYGNISNVLVEEWNPQWEVSPGVLIYGKPDVRVDLSSGRVLIGDAKTGKEHNWHRYQNKIALYAVCSGQDQLEPEAIVLKYSSQPEAVFEFCRTLDQVLSDLEIQNLAGACSAALSSDFPEFCPGSECRFCPFKAGCAAGCEYEQSILHPEKPESSDRTLSHFQSVPEPADLQAEEIFIPENAAADAPDHFASTPLQQSIAELEAFSHSLSFDQRSLYLNSLSLLMQQVLQLETSLQEKQDVQSSSPNLDLEGDRVGQLLEQLSHSSLRLETVQKELEDLNLKYSESSARLKESLQKIEVLQASLEAEKSKSLQMRQEATAVVDDIYHLESLLERVKDIAGEYTRHLGGQSEAVRVETPPSPAAPASVKYGFDCLGNFAHLLSCKDVSLGDLRIFGHPHLLNRESLLDWMMNRKVIVLRDPYGHYPGLTRRVHVQCLLGKDAIAEDYFSREYQASIFLVSSPDDELYWIREAIKLIPETVVPDLMPGTDLTDSSYVMSFDWNPDLGFSSPELFIENIILIQQE